jgi:branched-chain amino acid:cation transporter, LIVCS family
MNHRVLIVGFAVFAMFFGAGNVVLPLMLTQKWLNQWPMAFLGFCFSGVFVTLLGLIGAVLAKDLKSFFMPLGLVGGITMQVILICIEGPFGIVPRSLIVALGGIESIFPAINKIYFYACGCAVLYVLALNRGRLVSVIGKYLTPLMLLFLSILVIYTYKYNHTNIFDGAIISRESLYDGLTMGYLTYDLPGAIFFTSIAVGYLTAISKDGSQIIQNGIKSTIISAILLALVYAAFFYIGISYKDILVDVPPQQLLPSIVKNAMGHVSTYLFALFICLACLTTAVAAIAIWTDFIYLYISRFGLSYKKTLAVSLVIAFSVATLDFNGLMSILSPILNIVYPILIILTVYNIFVRTIMVKQPHNI